MQNSNLKVKKINHRGAPRIAIITSYDKERINKIKQISGYRWSQSRKCWHVPYSTEAFQSLKELFGEVIINSPNGPVQSYPQKQERTETNVTTSKTDNSFNPETLPKQTIILELENKYRIKAKVHYQNTEWISIIKNIPGRVWNPKLKYWSLPYVKQTFYILKHQIGKALKINFKVNPKIPRNYSKPIYHNKSKTKSWTKNNLNSNQLEALTQLEEQLLYERCSYRTISAYINQAKHLFRYYPNTPPDKITDNQIKDFVINKIKKTSISVSSQNQFINAIKAYYKRVLHQDREILDLRRPKKPNSLPHILSQPEVVKILNSVDNLKHKCILMLVYSAGLRVSEVIGLKIKDIDSQRMQIFIQGGKGKKDRYTILSKKTLTMLRLYFKQYHPFDWLFEGIHGGQYSARSVQNIFQTAVKKTRIKKRPTLHTLRHSFATHLLEKGINLRYIQSLLGHESSRTTEIYTHITKLGINKIESPLDGLDL